MNAQTDHEAGRFSRSELKSFKTHALMMAAFAGAMCLIIPRGMGWVVAASLAALMMLAPPLTILALRRLKRKGQPDA
jgi:hypothetical protein